MKLKIWKIVKRFLLFLMAIGIGLLVMPFFILIYVKILNYVGG